MSVKTGGSDVQTQGNSALSAKPPAMEQQIRSTLLQDVLELTARFEDATSEFESVTGQDGVQRIKNASNKLSTAREELMKAHRRLDEFPKTLNLKGNN